MNVILKNEAIVLKKKQLLQKDILITLLTNELGKVTVIAKGIKNITSRRAPHIQTGTLLNVVLSNRGHAFYLQQSGLISAFSALREDGEKLNHMYTFFFILDRILPEQQKEEYIFTLTKKFLIELSKTENSFTVVFKQYLQKLLFNLGYLQEDKSLLELIGIVEDLINEKVPLHAII